MPHPQRRSRQALLVASTLLLAAPVQQAQATVFEKATFVLHLGAAYYAFNTWVWKPYRQYKFKVGAPGQRANIAKAGLALLFAAYQVNSAIKMTQHTNDPFLKQIGALLPNFSKSLTSVGNNLKNGNFDEQGIQDLNKTANTLLNTAESQGQPIRPVAVPIPGL
ncbi:hypothetical protein DKM44_03385 [Deinococcus irradiatisoli]|uniref:Uncharacterized protein n=1 Tax=Deinococcus irradiatisoli TaxID=2202254 RepID=A0A2Z3JB70_9DEIO|nr:hypothetical protein [Deinococcus irradiatisoli]AWN22393.1 hypothetical protein DKM44_03385 [Deinococcus irradiatisoli]